MAEDVNKKAYGQGNCSGRGSEKDTPQCGKTWEYIKTRKTNKLP